MESWAPSADYFITASLSTTNKAVLCWIPSMAAFGRFPFSGLLHVCFLQHLEGALMCCFLISRLKGPALFLPVTGLKISFPVVGKMAYSKVWECWSGCRLPSERSDHSSWLRTGTGQQLHVTCKKVPVEIWDETECSILLKDVRLSSLAPPPLWLNLWGLNSANQYRSQFYTESLSCWESSTLKSEALKGLHWEANSLEIYFFFLEEISALISLMTKLGSISVWQ